MSDANDGSRTHERGKDWLPAELAERLRVQSDRLAEFRGRL
jgi:hypothetical protein